MSEHGPSPRTPDGPATGVPFEELVTYFATHLARYTPEALARTAELAGHAPETVARAMALARERSDRDAEVDRMSGLKRRARQIAIAAYAAGFVIVAAPLLLVPNWTGGGLWPLVIGQLILALIMLGISLGVISGRRGAPRGMTAALVSLLAVPTIIFLVFPGICIYVIYTSLPAR